MLSGSSHFRQVVTNWGRQTVASENATVFRTPTAGDPALAEVVRRLIEAYQPARMYLFGSVARGDAGPHSDYDILVVVAPECTADRRPASQQDPASLYPVPSASHAEQGFHSRRSAPANRPPN
jgi:hypothetical protein